MTMGKKKFKFWMNNLSDEIIVEGKFTDSYPKEVVKKILKTVREQQWFLEGDITKGEILFYNSESCIVEWDEILMEEGYETEKFTHNETVLINFSGICKVITV